jgi:hypothetical protein
MGKRKLFIHAGLQKSGSTSFHRYLKQNETALSDHIKPIFPKGKSLARMLGRVAMKYSMAPSKERLTRIRAVGREILLECENLEQDVLITHENILGAMPGVQEKYELYPSFPKISGALVDIFSDYDVEFIVTTREINAWKKSVYAEGVKSDRFTQEYESFIFGTNYLGDWDQLDQHLNASAPTTLFAIEDETSREHPGQNLLEHCGVPKNALATFSPIGKEYNARFTDEMIEFARALNKSDIALSELKKSPRLWDAAGNYLNDKRPNTGSTTDTQRPDRSITKEGYLWYN